MAFSKSLLIKGLAAGIALGGVGVAIHQRKNIAALLSPSSGKKKVWGGLECGETDGSECSINGEIFVKRGSDNPFKLTTLGSGKIKTYKDNTYQEGFKFLIEDNDIGSDSNKLEQFETYEIKLGEDSETDETLKGKHYLSRKTEAKTEIKKALGLPNENCNLPDNGASQDCSITTENIKTIKFKEETATVSATVKLTISTDSSKEEYPLGYKFSFKNEGDTDVNLTIGEETITLKKDSPVDFKIKKSEKGNEISLEKAWALEDLVKKVGLKKGASGDYWDIDTGGLNVKQDTNKEVGKCRQTNQEGKIKLEKDQVGYNQGFKFSIENGDININDANSSVKVLGHYETYEISKDADGKWYLSRKTDSKEKVKTSLGLPCELPTNNTPVDCSINTSNIGQIKFDGGTPSITGTPKLTISVVDERGNYPLGYKFAFTSEGESSITIGSTNISLKQNLIIDFKIKISGANKDTLTLEKAFTADDLMYLVSLDKEGNDAWAPGDGYSYIKQGENKSSKVTGANPKNAKIRVYEGTPGYNQGMKFVVEDGDTNLSGGGMSKLSRYETYEVVKDSTDNNYYFTRKLTSSESIKDILGIHGDCTMPSAETTTQTCSLNADKLKAIKFEGKTDAGTVTIEESGSITLTISRETNSSDFPKNYKFTFSSSQQSFTIPQTSGSISIKKNTNTEFKIKENGNKLTLEKAWTPEKLGKKVNLKDCNGDKKCSFGDKINVYEEDSKYVYDAEVSDKTKKISYLEEQEGYNQGIKFYVEGDDIDINNGNKTGEISKICKKDNDFPGYQIMEKTIGDQKRWYLVKKSQ